MHFFPITHEGDFISRSGIDVIFNTATHQIVSVRSENNEGIPYTIRLSPEDQQFIQDSLASYLRQLQQTPRMSVLPRIPGMPALPGIPGMPVPPRF